MISKELQELLDNTPPVDENIDFEFPDLMSDPEFVADLMKGLFVDDILKAMDESDISKSKLAELLGMSRQYVGRVLNETANFTVDSISKIACALGKSVQVKLYAHDEVLLTKSLDDYRMEKETKDFSSITVQPNVQQELVEKDFKKEKIGGSYDYKDFDFVA